MVKIRPSFYALAFLLPLGLVPCVAQKTVVQDAGAGRKQELLYDASGQIVETRTLGSNGKLEQKNLFDFKPGFLVAQQTVFSYWQDGKSPKYITRQSYDESANFTAEAVERFDPAGRHDGGHKMTHDPFTGIYRCRQWSPSAQRYQNMECPAGEEGGEHDPLPALNYEEAAKLEADARQTARGEVKLSPLSLELGLVLPAQPEAGQRISGSITADPTAYDGVPGLKVVRFSLPPTATGHPPLLSGWRFEIAGAVPQAANTPVTFTVPSGSERPLSFVLRDSADPMRVVTGAIKISGPSLRKARNVKSKFSTAPLCIKGSFCTIAGPFDGDAAHTFAAFDRVPAILLAENEDRAYITAPKDAPNGAQHLILCQGDRLVVFPVSMGQASLEYDATDLKQGEQISGTLRFTGAGELEEDQWRAGPPPENLRGFKLERLRAEDKDAGEEQGKDGVVLVLLQNLAPGRIALNTMKNLAARKAAPGTLAFRLSEPSFSHGDFVYHFTVKAKQAGPIAVKAYAIPFLAPVMGQELSAAKK